MVTKETSTSKNIKIDPFATIYTIILKIWKQTARFWKDYSLLCWNVTSSQREGRSKV